MQVKSQKHKTVSLQESSKQTLLRTLKLLKESGVLIFIKIQD